MKKPRFITHPENSYSEDHRLNCLAWWLVTSKTLAELAHYQQTQKTPVLELLQPRIDRCEAWHLLMTCSPAQIRGKLASMEKTKQHNLRAWLNQMRAEAREIHQNQPIET